MQEAKENIMSEYFFNGMTIAIEKCHYVIHAIDSLFHGQFLRCM